MAVQLNVVQASDARDALVKAMYGKLFDWLVIRINTTLGSGHQPSGRNIGILDIFGFEVGHRPKRAEFDRREANRSQYADP